MRARFRAAVAALRCRVTPPTRSSSIHSRVSHPLAVLAAAHVRSGGGAVRVVRGQRGDDHRGLVGVQAPGVRGRPIGASGERWAASIRVHASGTVRPRSGW
jgi:hypothetical protein